MVDDDDDDDDAAVDEEFAIASCPKDGNILLARDSVAKAELMMRTRNLQ